MLLGIDIGTTGCKSVFYDSAGNAVSSGYRSYEILSPRDGWAEIDADDWWNGVCAATKEALAQLGGGSRRLRGICVSCANAIVPVDSDGRPLCRAVMQVDQRSLGQAECAARIIPQETFLEETGNFVRTGGFSPSVILWFKDNQRELYDSAHKFLAPSGFVVQKMTGNFTIDYSRASTAALMDIKKLRWSAAVCGPLGIDARKLPELFNTEAEAGLLKPDAAKAMGLDAGVPVAVGLMDSAAAMLGAGCVSNNDASLVIGTVSRLCYPMPESNFSQTALNAYFIKDAPYMAMAPTNGGGVSYKWFADSFGEREKSLAETLGISYYELLDRGASLIEAGCGGLLYLPYILGERSPI